MKTIVDKSALLARAKADPVAFREETAKALEAALWRKSADNLRRFGALPSNVVLARMRSDASDPSVHGENDRVAIAHVEALAEAMGALEGQ